MTPLREQLVRFIAALRSAGVRISVAESIDAMNAVAAAGIERARMHEALAAALIKDEADRAIFDESFSKFFAAPARERGEHPDHRGAQVSAASGRGRPGEDPAPHDDAPPRKSDEPREGAGLRQDESSIPREERSEKRASSGRKKAEPSKKSERAEAEQSSDRKKRDQAGPREESAASGIDAARVERIRAIERMPFEKFSDLDYDEAREALAPLVRRFRIRLGRRLRLARAGRIDFRRTIRAGLQRGGALIDLNFRERRPRHVDLVILADISGSVRYAAQLMLELIAGTHG